MTRKVAVVGASSGLGRSIALGLAARGDRVALLARRLDRLEEAAAEAGNDAHSVVCDVTDESQANRAIAEAADRLGGLDGLVYAAGVLAIEPVDETNAATWRKVLDVNVVGASIVTRAALAHLRSSHGRAVYLSSISSTPEPHWPYLGAYAASKAALNKLIAVWADEHPEVFFTRLLVGDCAGGAGHSATELISGVDPDHFEAALHAWMSLGLSDGSLVEVEDLVHRVDEILSSDATIASSTVAPRPAP